MSTSDPSDLHAAFSAPADTPVDDRERFLRAADRLPGLVPVRAALRRATAPPAGGTLVDAGCGLGLETARIAADHPAVTVVGLDHDPGILAAARRLAPDLPNLRWTVGDLTASGLPAGSVDTLRTERVLMYVADLGAAADAIGEVLRPGGVYAGFELDYGAIVLPAAGRSRQAVRLLTACLEDALPQPWAGRLLPEALAARGLEVHTVEPFAITVDHPVFQRIVAGTLLAAAAAGTLDDPGLDAWLSAVGDVDGPRAVAFTGIVTVARRPGCRSGPRRAAGLSGRGRRARRRGRRPGRRGRGADHRPGRVRVRASGRATPPRPGGRCPGSGTARPAPRSASARRACRPPAQPLDPRCLRRSELGGRRGGGSSRPGQRVRAGRAVHRGAGAGARRAPGGRRRAQPLPPSPGRVPRYHDPRPRRRRGRGLPGAGRRPRGLRRRVRGLRRTGLWDTWADVLALLGSGRLELDWIVTHRLDLADVADAVELLTGDAGKGLLLP